MRRTLFWTAVLVALAAVGGGGAYAYLGYRATSGPSAVVRGYFAALARSEAPAALGYGAVPDGSHALLTGAVLAQQQHLAPLHDVQIIDVAQTGDAANVRYSYELRFARGEQQFTGTLRLTHGGAGWRLSRTAITRTLHLDAASDRVTLAGTSIPDGPTLLFPGALPLRVDTPYLQVAPATSAVQFAGDSTIDISIQPTAATRRTLQQSLLDKLTACVSGPTASVTCPLPSSRLVPGSLRGRIAGGIGNLAISVGPDAVGTIRMAGAVIFSGSYRRLDYDNLAQSQTGRLSLRVEATAYPVAPLTVRFASAT